MNLLFAEELAQVAERLRRSTVQIQGRSGVGSGVVWQKNLIITNAHVLRGSKATVQLWDDRELTAEVVARDAQRDLAALWVANADLADVPPVTIGNPAELRVGDLVLAVGNPMGIAGAVTFGIVHAMPPVLKFPRWIQADVRLAPGNSGGALADGQGRVVGVNTLIVEGCAYAISSRAIERFLSSQASRPYLGITLRPIDLRRGPVANNFRRADAIGWLILNVNANSPAATSGLQAGDLLIGINEMDLTGAEEFTDLLDQLEPEEVLHLKLIRGNQTLNRSLQVGRWEREAA